jgi:glycosyltransferase involved in cell wall biosynthesis
MKALYLFTNSRSKNAEEITRLEYHDNHFFGMYRLKKYGVDADFLELENTFPKKVAHFLRRHISMHFVHVPLLPYMFSYDVLLTSSSLGTLLVRKIFHLRPKKVVMFDYNISGQLSTVRTWKERVFRWIINGVDGFVTLSREEAEAMKKIYPKKAENIAFFPFACDSSYYKPAEGFKEENFILSVGRDPGRDLSTLCKAMSGLGVSCKVTAKKSQLDAVVDIPKEIERHDFSTRELLEEYTKAKIVVIALKVKYPNDTMGCSSLVEAMSMGKVVIATGTVTMRNYITDGVNGRLVPQSDSSALTTVIKELLQDDEQRKMLGRNAREFVVKNCDPENYAKELVGYLKKVT